MNRRMWREEKEFVRDIEIFNLVFNLGTSYKIYVFIYLSYDLL